MEPGHVFALDGVTKQYRRSSRPANDAISLEVVEGEIFGILGDNGAGKTTLVRQMAGLTSPTSGRIAFRGRPLAEAGAALTSQIGYMPQSAFALNHLRVEEAIFYTGRLRGLRRDAARIETARLIDAWGLGDVSSRVAKQLSGGQRRLLQLAVTMAAAPPILVLDEPTNDLDPLNRKRVWQLLRAANTAGSTVIFVTHDAVEAEKVIDRVAIMRHGRVVAVGRPRDLKAKVDDRFRLDLTGDPLAPPTLPPALSWTELEPGRWRAMLAKADVGPILAAVDAHQFDDVRLASATLEDLYLHYASD
jgi:ABC-2 type transport system ATP-binding protein